MSTPSVVERVTKETTVRVAAVIGTGVAVVETSVPFLDHMLVALAKYSGVDLTVSATGDLRHHIIEDVALTVGQAIAGIVPVGAARYGERTVPMDEALTRVAIDISGRPFLVFKAEFVRDKVGTFDTELVQEWFQAFAMNAGVTLHVENLYGTNDHHISESCFKGLARALRTAFAIDPRAAGEVPSTKGTLGN